MLLINNEDGTWDQSKTNIHQDLTKIQDNINQILARLNAVAAPTIPPAAVIAPSNQVTIPNGVFTKLMGALIGNGLVDTPLGVNVDGTTVTVNSLNQLVAGGTISVNPAGALSGNGTGGSPLAVKVDGVTIDINGSNQLESLVTSKILFQVGSFGPSQIDTMHSVPVTVITAVPNKTIIPLFSVMSYNQVGALNFSSSSNSHLEYVGAAGTNILGMGEMCNNAVPTTRNSVTLEPSTGSTIITPASPTTLGSDIVCVSNFDVGHAFLGGFTCNWTIGYTVI